MNATRALAQWASAITFAASSAPAQTMAERAYLDFLACTLAGSKTPAASAARDGFPELAEGGGRCSVLGTSFSAPAHVAAFLNGQACHILEYDDVHHPSIYHPGAPTIAAALAIAERDGISGAELLAAIIAGYEVGIRLGEAAGTAHYKHFHTTGTVGVVGAATAAGRALGLSGDRLTDAIGLSVTHAAGLWAFIDDRGDSKPYHPAHAAMMGVICADLARAGVVGARTGIEGPHGFLVTLGGDPASPALTEGLGNGAERITTLNLKAYSCCGHTHAGLEAALSLQAALARDGLAAKDIAAVEIATYASAIAVAGRMQPANVAEANFSYSHIVAWVLTHGTIAGAFTDAALADADVRALAARVTPVHRADFDSAYPTKQPVRITVRLANGQARDAYGEHATGAPELPMSDAVHAAKVHELIGDASAPWTAHARAIATAPVLRLVSAAQTSGAAASAISPSSTCTSRQR